MTTPTKRIVPCPICGHATEVIDQKTAYRMEQQAGTAPDQKVPDSTAYTHRCLKNGCGHIFTRSVKH
jgi:hypothetical protein